MKQETFGVNQNPPALAVGSFKICVSCSGALVLRCEFAAVITSFAKPE